MTSPKVIATIAALTLVACAGIPGRTGASPKSQKAIDAERTGQVEFDLRAPPSPEEVGVLPGDTDAFFIPDNRPLEATVLLPDGGRVRIEARAAKATIDTPTFQDLTFDRIYPDLESARDVLLSFTDTLGVPEGDPGFSAKRVEEWYAEFRPKFHDPERRTASNYYMDAREAGGIKTNVGARVNPMPDPNVQVTVAFYWSGVPGGTLP